MGLERFQMRAGFLLFLLPAGCTSLLGIDDWSSQGGASSTAIGSGALGGGGSGGHGGVAGSASASSASTGTGGGGGEMCSGAIACYWGPLPGAVVAGMAPCNPGPAVATCVPPDWDYCGCDGESPAVFIELDKEFEPFAITLLAPTVNAPYNIGLNNADCINPVTMCDITSDCPGDSTLYRFTSFGPVQPKDIHNLHVWWKDVEAPCDGGPIADKGERIFILNGL